MADAREQRLELILHQLEALPTLPAVAVRVLQATAASDSSLDEIVQLLEADQALSANILHLVNRAELGGQPANSAATVRRAVSLLGFEAVRSAVLSLTAFNTLQ